MTDHDTARDALAERLLEACVASLDLLHVYVGDRLGLYEALAAGPLSAGELAGLRPGRCSLGHRQPPPSRPCPSQVQERRGRR